jgi:hypothetical protein
VDLKGCGLVLCASAAVLAGCDESQPPIRAPGAMPQSRAVVTHADRGGSWMLPKATSENLIYIADVTADAVEVYSYTDRTKVGHLREDAPEGECADNAGNVWIVENDNRILEYAHGGTKPIAKLVGPYNSDLRSCSLDPSTGDLAVTAFEGPVYVYRQAKGPPTKYSSCGYNCASMDYCAYDDQGNLYVVGTVGEDSSNYRAAVWEVKGHHGALIRLKFHDRVTFPFSGGIFWDGQHMAWEDEKFADIYQFVRPTGGHAKIVGRTELNVESGIGQGTIHGQTVVIPYFVWKSQRGVAFFNYPAGGKRIAHIGDLRHPVAVAFSAAVQDAKRHR